MYWNGDWSWGAWIAMVVMMLAFWGSVAWIIVTIVRSTDSGRPASRAERILAERLARGEISKDEYTDLRETIRR